MERADLTKAGIVFAATPTEGGLGTERQAAAAPPTVSGIAGRCLGLPASTCAASDEARGKG
jgi:hypothetical protein